MIEVVKTIIPALIQTPTNNPMQEQPTSRTHNTQYTSTRYAPQPNLGNPTRTIQQRISSFRRPGGRSGGRGNPCDDRHLDTRDERTMQLNTLVDGSKLGTQDENYWGENYDLRYDDTTPTDKLNPLKQHPGGYPSTVAPPR